ncbi:uncharacterized protein EDB91DRAFT_1335039 [Suillus paluster]|uniref:uncharacterized protein n=1 Tax=Suillus paluster TaxID=48578 RepID=UPI001B87A3F5|nr:uncharacterized protein EDB91DRAFT_1335039 [Suillus paluster]KAG1746628.1 hypothetical protein EDB91DRAFT_1335039 [Suillus paluster]
MGQLWDHVCGITRSCDSVAVHIIMCTSYFESQHFDLQRRGSDISKDPMNTNASDLPEDWKPPSWPFARFCFTGICLFALSEPDLEELWQKQEVARFVTLQALTFKMLVAPRLQTLDHTFQVDYQLLIYVAYLWGLLALGCEWLLFRTGLRLANDQSRGVGKFPESLTPEPETVQDDASHKLNRRFWRHNNSKRRIAALNKTPQEKFGHHGEDEKVVVYWAPSQHEHGPAVM